MIYKDDFDFKFCELVVYISKVYTLGNLPVSEHRIYKPVVVNLYGL